jgi:hypothetical protein
MLERRRHYEDRIQQIEHGCLTPFVFSLSGSLGPAANVIYKRLASLQTNFNINIARLYRG